MSADKRKLAAAVFVGGAAGALLRVWLDEKFTGAADAWPWVTFSINVTGSFALGYLATHLSRQTPSFTTRQALLCTGFCGAYTTFSTFQLELLKMIENHWFGLAASYAAASVVCGYTALLLGRTTAKGVTLRTTPKGHDERG